MTTSMTELLADTLATHPLSLRMVASYTELLAKRYKGRLDSDADEFIGFAVDGCNRMKVMIEDLLAFALWDKWKGTPRDFG